MKNCGICGRKLVLYKKSNVRPGSLSSFSYASRKEPEYMHWDLYECKDCHVLYSDCPSDTNEIFAKYEEADYDSSVEADFASITYFNYLNDILPNYPKHKALDIGTGNGSYLGYLKQQGVCETVGVEPSKQPIAHASSLIKDCIINAPFQKDMFKKGEFDMVSLFQTVEHVPNPYDMFMEIRRILAHGGYFYLICHDYKSFVNRILGMKSPIYDIEHLQIFSKKSIIRLMKKSGFKDIRVFTIKNEYPLRYWIRLFPLPEDVKSKMMRIMLKSIGNVMIGVNVGNVGVIARR